MSSEALAPRPLLALSAERRDGNMGAALLNEGNAAECRRRSLELRPVSTRCRDEGSAVVPVKPKTRPPAVSLWPRIRRVDAIAARAWAALRYHPDTSDQCPSQPAPVLARMRSSRCSTRAGWTPARSARKRTPPPDIEVFWDRGDANRWLADAVTFAPREVTVCGFVQHRQPVSTHRYPKSSRERPICEVQKGRPRLLYSCRLTGSARSLQHARWPPIVHVNAGAFR
jgi:hypothetical protein